MRDNKQPSPEAKRKIAKFLVDVVLPKKLEKLEKEKVAN